MPDMKLSTTRTINGKRRSEEEPQLASKSERTAKRRRVTWETMHCYAAGCKEPVEQWNDEEGHWCNKHWFAPRCSKAGCREVDPKKLEKVADADSDDSEPEDEFRCDQHPLSSSESESSDVDEKKAEADEEKQEVVAAKAQVASDSDDD